MAHCNVRLTERETITQRGLGSVQPVLTRLCCLTESVHDANGSLGVEIVGYKIRSELAGPWLGLTNVAPEKNSR